MSSRAGSFTLDSIGRPLAVLLCAAAVALPSTPLARAQAEAGSEPGPIFTWDTTYSRCTSFNVGPCTSFAGQVRSRFLIGLNRAVFPQNAKDGVNGQTDNVLQWGYNYSLAGGPLVPGEAAFKQQIEASYWDGNQQLLEYNWDFMTPGGVQWRPLYLIFRTAPAGGTILPVDRSLLDLKMCQGCANLELTPFGHVNVGTFQPGQDTSRLLVDHSLSGSGPGPAKNRYGIQSILTVSLDSADDTGEFVGGTSKADWIGQRARPDTLGHLVGQQGLAEISGTASASRSVANFVTGVDARAWYTGSGPGNGSSNLVGLRAQASAHGQGPYTVNGYGILIASPASKGGRVTYQDGIGLWIQDMKGYGDQKQGALVIDAQTGGGGAKGNLVLAGGDADNGHIAAGSGHLWYDDRANHWRTKDGPPLGGSDGRAIVSGTGSVAFGPMLWSLKPAATCSSVCGNAGLSCQDAYPMTGGAAVGCANTTVAKSCLCK